MTKTLDPPANAAELSYHGFLDAVDNSVVRGWALTLNKDDVRPCAVVIYADGVLLARVEPTGLRDDLVNLFGGDGRYGFSYELPLSLADGRPHRINVLIAETGGEIASSPKISEITPWRGSLDQVGAGSIAGWACDLQNRDGPCWVDIRVDNVFLARVLAAEPRLDLKDSLGASGKHSFAYELPLSFMDGRPHHISVRFGGTNKELEGSPKTIDEADYKAAPLLLQQERIADLMREAAPYDTPGVGPAALRAHTLAPALSYEWTAIGLEAGPDGPSQIVWPMGWAEEAAVAMSIPRARLYRWDAFSSGPGRIADASFQSAAITGYPFVRKIGEDYFLDRAIAAPRLTLEQDVVHLFRPGAYNHYHWLIEILPQIWALKQMPFADRPILVNEASFKTGRMEWMADRAVKLECLDALGYAGDRLMFTDAAIVDVGMAHIPLAQTNPLLKPALSIYAPLKEALSKRSTLAPGPGAKLMISRSAAPSRRLLNEDAVMELLAPQGFNRVVLEKMPLKDQVALFASADTILAPHGAGLANIVFLASGARVVELLPVGMKDRAFIYSRLCHLFGVKHATIMCPSSQNAGGKDDYEVDLALISAALDIVN